MTTSPRPTDAESLLEAFASSWNSRDAQALAAVFTDNGDYVDFSGHWLQGTDHIRNAHQFVLDGPLAGSHIRFTDQVTRTLTDYTIIVHAHWELTNISHAIDPTGTRRGIITFTCIDEHGRPAITAGQNTLITASEPFSDH